MRNLNREGMVLSGIVVVALAIAAAFQWPRRNAEEGRTYYCSVVAQQNELSKLGTSGSVPASGQTLECHRDRRSPTDLAVIVETPA